MSPQVISSIYILHDHDNLNSTVSLTLTTSYPNCHYSINTNSFTHLHLVALSIALYKQSTSPLNYFKDHYATREIMISSENLKLQNAVRLWWIQQIKSINL